jgi:HemX protein
MTVLTNLVLYVFALSLLFSIADLFQRNKNARDLAAGLLGVVWIMQAAFFLSRLFADNTLPVISSFETIYFFAWVLVTFALVSFFFLRTEVFFHGISIIGFVVLLFSLNNSATTVRPYMDLDDAVGIWPLHIALSIGAYGLFTVSALFAGTYLYMHRRLKTKTWTPIFHRLPNLQWMDKMAYRFALVGWAALSVALLLGCGWLVVIGEAQMLNDPKVYASLVVFFAYGVYIWRSARLSMVATRLATWNLIVYALVLVNFTMMNVLSGFHKWGG